MRRLARVAAGAAVLTLTACSHSGSPGAESTPGGASGAGGDGATAPVSCHQQYRTWTKAQGKGVMNALHNVSSAAAAGKGQALTAALVHAKPVVAKATVHPIPACADPRGYWSVLLMHVNAAAAGAGSADGTRAAMHDVPDLMDSLVADIHRATR